MQTVGTQQVGEALWGRWSVEKLKGGIILAMSREKERDSQVVAAAGGLAGLEVALVADLDVHRAGGDEGGGHGGDGEERELHVD